MFFSVRELELRKIQFQKAFQPGEIEFSEAGLRQSTALQAAGVAELAGPLHEIRVRGRLAGSVECACDRCLEPVSVPVHGEIDLFYRPAESDSDAPPETGLSDAETEIGFYEGGGLDLAEVVREQVLLALPMQRVCRADCQGICPGCGRNRNTGRCECRTERVDERWDALRHLRASGADE